MKNDLYFIAELARAFQHPDPGPALDEAFQRIQSLGRLPAYRRGYRQFLEFMREIMESAGQWEWTQWNDQMLRTFALVPGPVLVLTRDDQVLERSKIPSYPFTICIPQIVAGHYALRLDTGWVLWEGTLSPRDLIRQLAFPDQPLELAADTGDHLQETPTRTLELLNSEITVKVFAGLEAGRMAIEVRPAEGNGHGR